MIPPLSTNAAPTKRAGIKNLILGSGGARRLPDGYDNEKAKTEFALLAKKMAINARKQGITIILENLNNTETNFINKLKDAADVVRAVNHPNFKLNADIYHMMKEGESPQEIVNARGLLIYSEIVEVEQRTLPGVVKENFIPYLQALKAINFKGPILIEGRSQNLQKDVPNAYVYLTNQLKAAYSKTK